MKPPKRKPTIKFPEMKGDRYKMSNSRMALSSRNIVRVTLRYSKYYTKKIK